VVEYESLGRDDDPMMIVADAEWRRYKELGDSAFTQKGIVASDRHHPSSSSPWPLRSLGVTFYGAIQSA